MPQQGWVKLHRKICNSFVWTNADQLKLWLLILMKASHDNHRFLFNGKQVDVSSGQLVTGRDALAFEFNDGVSRDHRVVARTLWRWLKALEESGYVERNIKYKGDTKEIEDRCIKVMQRTTR